MLYSYIYIYNKYILKNNIYDYNINVISNSKYFFAFSIRVSQIKSNLIIKLIN